MPAHSCVLSALSPQLSCALSSTPPPPSGQSRLLDFQAIKACALLRLVGLLYSGEMMGEGEVERQEAISAAARLGIHDLVEVGKRDGKEGREEEETLQREVGVQMEPSQLRREQRGAREGEWRREERDGSTLLWKETQLNGERDTGTQTGEFETNTAHPPHPLVSFQTVDISAIQNSGATVSSGNTDPQFLPHHMPYVPLSLLYPPDGSQASARLPPPPSSIFIPPTEECFAAGQAPVYSLPRSYSSLIPSCIPSGQVTEGPAPFAPDPLSWGAEPPGAVDAGEQFERFEGNIPGFISHFFNPHQEEAAAPRGRSRGRRRSGGGAGGARRARTGERRARRPQGRRGGGGGRGRPRGKKTAEVVEEVPVVSAPKKDWWQRRGVPVSRRGIGGGVVGRKLFLKTRELLLQQPIKIYLKRRGRGEVWEVFGVGDEKGRATKGQDRRRSRGQQSSTQLTQVRSYSLVYIMLMDGILWVHCSSFAY